MHEAIVSREDWQKCESMREKTGRIRSTQNKSVSPFTGLLICSDCGYKLVRTNSYYTVKATGERKNITAYNCAIYSRKGKTACSSRYISESALTEVVLDKIHELAEEILTNENTVRERYFTLKTQTDGAKLKSVKNELKKVTKRLAELDTLLKSIFEKSVLGGNSEIFSKFETDYTEEKQNLTQKADKLTEDIDKYSQNENDAETFIALIKKYRSMTKLSRAAAVELIDHITVFAPADGERKIVIYFNFMGNI
jgi:hypothetical protein